MKGLAQTLVLTGAVRAADLSAAIDKVGDGPELPQLLVSASLVTEAQVAEAAACTPATSSSTSRARRSTPTSFLWYRRASAAATI
ncbi:hypothetical protein [Microbacterium sp.]|uniref:hypothetical protein n=1 Tax=Microbacterium sp. TaxID=51671 RepID=UPI002580C268|nr:hypothetical protein [Microbacterium sp.]|tara:strand:+ start:349 stop:603 length:255 start_codon:yes stop_codon:yes gene_type:complete